MNNVGRKGASPSQLKSGFGQASGHDVSSARVQNNSAQPGQMQAHAYAQGNNIRLGAGQAQHLPHEVGHVIQQRQGAVKPTSHSGGIGINSSPRLERQADAMGKRAAHGAAKKF